ncbi:anti-sigma F factor antagonist [Capsulimonas corticalis]|uniref:Anti-sigma factor antagonist n=1 Tax=Capsulimonas corticalis TaxID=2219043 RepID=A0A402D3Q7_9BACT|nr:STAS domain-containing protein [Capsulimonas corticalis]BDI31858.1 anti-sigma F factor antagonist [Capsulimonas corticalis]
MAELHIDVHNESAVATVLLRGELDAYSAPRLRQVLDPLIKATDPAILVDLTALEYLDSAGLGVLVAALKQVTDRDGQFGVISPSPIVARVLQVTGLFKLFTIFSDPAEAQASFGLAA